MLGISPKNPYVILKYLGGLHHHLREQVMLFKPKSVDEAYVHAQYLENIGLKRAQWSGSKHKEKQDACKEGKKKKKGEKFKRHQPKYTSAKILGTTVTTATLMTI